MDNGELEGQLSDMHVNGESQEIGIIKAAAESLDDDVQITCFTEDLCDATLHFQIIKFSKQIYAWIGCNSAKLGHLYAAASTRTVIRILPTLTRVPVIKSAFFAVLQKDSVSVTSLLRVSADNTGSSMARRLVLKTGLSVLLACNIPKDSPKLEAAAERKLVEKLRNLGYLRTDR